MDCEDRMWQGIMSRFLTRYTILLLAEGVDETNGSNEGGLPDQLYEKVLETPNQRIRISPKNCEMNDSE